MTHGGHGHVGHTELPPPERAVVDTYFKDHFNDVEHINPIEYSPLKGGFVRVHFDDTGERHEEPIDEGLIDPDTLAKLKQARALSQAMEVEATTNARWAGSYDPIAFALYVKRKYFQPFSLHHSRELSEMVAVFCEGDKMPRSMGMGSRDDTTGEFMWFDENIAWEYTGTEFTWHGSWRKGIPKDLTVLCQRYKDNSWNTIEELPMEERAKWKGHPVQIPVDEDHPEVAALIAAGRQDAAEALMHEGLDQCARNYVGNITYRLERGNGEEWVQRFEPAFFLFQKPSRSEENCFPNIIQQRLEEHEALMKDFQKEMDKWAQEGDAIRFDEAKANFNRAKQWRDAYHTRATQHTMPKEFRYREDEAKDAPYRVASRWREFHHPGKLVFSEIPETLLVAIPGTRRMQARMKFTIGLEPEGGGEGKAGKVTARSVKYGLLSHSYDLQPTFTNIIFGKAGILNETIVDIQRHLDVYRAAMLLPPVKIAPVYRQEDLKTLTETEGVKEKGGGSTPKGGADPKAAAAPKAPAGETKEEKAAKAKADAEQRAARDEEKKFREEEKVQRAEQLRLSREADQRAKAQEIVSWVDPDRPWVKKKVTREEAALMDADIRSQKAQEKLRMDNPPPHLGISKEMWGKIDTENNPDDAKKMKMGYWRYADQKEYALAQELARSRGHVDLDEWGNKMKATPEENVDDDDDDGAPPFDPSWNNLV